MALRVCPPTFRPRLGAPLTVTASSNATVKEMASPALNTGLAALPWISTLPSTGAWVSMRCLSSKLRSWSSMALPATSLTLPATKRRPMYWPWVLAVGVASTRYWRASAPACTAVTVPLLATKWSRPSTVSTFSLKVTMKRTLSLVTLAAVVSPTEVITGAMVSTLRPGQVPLKVPALPAMSTHPAMVQLTGPEVAPAAGVKTAVYSVSLTRVHSPRLPLVVMTGGRLSGCSLNNMRTVAVWPWANWVSVGSASTMLTVGGVVSTLARGWSAKAPCSSTAGLPYKSLMAAPLLPRLMALALTDTPLVSVSPLCTT